jgi:histidinol-phosphate/aromatic aminotransferase/cobyric acid decarboxylase-like protein
LREELSAALRQLGWDVLPGSANFLLCHLPLDHPEASALVTACSKRKLFLRDVSSMGKCFDTRVLRVAVKDATTNQAIVNILRVTLAEMDAMTRRAAA